ncbi:MAG: hypothetical protein A2161_00570 [Candidatus Schekmanbacteria bacterium RBG_13_48_7]|uniref:Flagellar biosynthesis protein FlaG n=1 Tax=Candidatus Schekmanbacteria bacterium RBG_13_48_7 TaxID=1817878 RepID=A0A1F7RKB3_9BACT|nr:MAG: hypothetical protein A2161_00570 [Candidatus Schekmanbacteria bacterium RBG_13_48_7]
MEELKVTEQRLYTANFPKQTGSSNTRETVETLTSDPKKFPKSVDDTLKPEKEKDELPSNIQGQIDNLNNLLGKMDTNLRFGVDEKSSRRYYQVVNTVSNTVIKQYPPKELLEVLGKINEMIGIIVDEKV